MTEASGPPLLPVSTELIRADTGECLTVDELGRSSAPVWAYDLDLKVSKAVTVGGHPVGALPVVRLRLASGRLVDVLTTQSVMTIDGWRSFADVEVGVRLAVMRRLPEPVRPRVRPRHELVLLAHLIGDGCVSRSPAYYCSADEANLRAVEEAAHQFGVDTRRSSGRGVTYLHFPMRGQAGPGRTSPLYDWLRRLDLLGKTAATKRLPESTKQLSDAQTALFLKHLWATDGSVTIRPNGQVRIYYATVSRQLAEDVVYLLDRLGMGARLSMTRPRDPRHRVMWSVDVSGQADELRFVRDVGAHGVRGAACRQAEVLLSLRKANTNVDLVPRPIWDVVRSTMRTSGVTGRELARRIGMSFSGSALYRSAPSPERLSRVAVALDSPYLMAVAKADLRWDEVVEVQDAGTAPAVRVWGSESMAPSSSGLVVRLS